jgi:ATP-dependent exoDNAse (exonuclease V) beta subunit
LKRKDADVRIKSIGELRFPHLLLLEASAGTGKTQALAERFAGFLMASPKEVPNNRLAQFLAITFTKKAAQEMKERILRELKGMALRSDPFVLKKGAERLKTKPEALERLAEKKVEEILENYTDFQVQTIDSFTNRVIRAVALELEMRPVPKIALNYNELLPYALSLLLREVGPGGDRGTTKSAEAYLALLNRTSGRNFIWDPAADLEAKFGEFLEREAKEMGRLVFEDQGEELEKGFKEFQAVLKSVRKIYPEATIKKELETALEGRDFPRLLGWKYNSNTVPVKKAQGDVFKQAEQAWLTLDGVMERLALAYARGYYHPYGGMYAGFKGKLELAKKRSGEIHLDDVGLTLARHLQEENLPDVYLKMGDRLYHFLIDEFQDTNLLQWRSLLPLIRESLSKGGSLFLVGDLKQAIFMFRRGDYRIMRGLLEGIREGKADPEGLLSGVGPAASRETLSENHRSGEVILDFVEEVFQKKLKGLLGTEHFQKDVTGLTDFRQTVVPEHLGKGYVRTLAFHLEAEENPEPEKEALIGILRDLVTRGYDYQDVAILSGMNADLERMVGWLIEAGIPATATSALDIRKRKVVGELIELLKFLDSPVDDLAFAQFIGGEIFGQAAKREGLAFGPRDLSRLALRKSAYLYQAFREDGKGKVLWEKYFDDLYNKVGYCPLYELLSSALAAFDVLQGFEGEAGALLRLLEVVNQLEEEGKNSLRDLLELAGDEKEELFAQELPEYTNAVRLLTFHKAKGLGFPVVINRLTEPKGGGGERFAKTGEEIRPYYLTGSLKDRSPELRRMAEERELDGQTQGLNTLYVALTRAREELYNLVILEKEGGRGGREGILPTLFEEGEWGRKEKKPKGKKPPPEATPARIPLVREMRKRPGERWSYERWLEARKGEAYHKDLEEMEFLSGKPKEDLAKALEKHRGETGEFSSPGEIEARLAEFLALPQVKELFLTRPGRTILREASFVEESGEMARMDRVIVDESEVAVVDFKTGGERAYEGQIERYKTILARVYPGKVVKGYLAYVDSGKVIEV